MLRQAGAKYTQLFSMDISGPVCPAEEPQFNTRPFWSHHFALGSRHFLCFILQSNFARVLSLAPGFQDLGSSEDQGFLCCHSGSVWTGTPGHSYIWNLLSGYQGKKY